MTSYGAEDGQMSQKKLMWGYAAISARLVHAIRELSWYPLSRINRSKLVLDRFCNQAASMLSSASVLEEAVFLFLLYSLMSYSLERDAGLSDGSVSGKK